VPEQGAQGGQAEDEILQLPLFGQDSAPTSNPPSKLPGPTDPEASAELIDGAPRHAVEAQTAEGMGIEWRNSDPFPPPPPFLLPGEHLRKCTEKCIAYIIQHEGLGRSAGFEQFLFLLCAKLFEERNPGMPRRFWAEEKEARADEGCALIGERIDELFDELKEAHPSVFGSGDRLTLSNRTIAFVVTALGKHCLSATELDPLGVAYQQWTSAIARYDRGQFLTPLGAAFYAVCMLDPQEGERVLDNSCGCGAFLAALYAYRAAQLGLEFAAGIPAVPAPVEEVPESEARARLARYMSTRVYGAELDSFLAAVARKQMALAQGAPAHIYHMDSLAFPGGGSEAERAAAAIPLGSLDCIVGNPPFSMKITDRAVLDRYELARIWTRQGDHGYRREDRISKRVYSETLFLERAIDWLKPGGRLALIVPDGILCEMSTAYARDWLLKQAVLLAVVSLPDETFYVESRTHTKTSVLLLRKKTEAELQADGSGTGNYSVFMAIAEKVGISSRGRTLYKRGPDGEELLYEGRRLVDNDLPIILSRYRQFRESPLASPRPGEGSDLRQGGGDHSLRPGNSRPQTDILPSLL
jgi:type I restriction enzyme M protein